MTIQLPPDLDVLRSFIRGELSPEDRKLVNRWCGRCVDERLPTVLENLQIEWEQEQADSTLQGTWKRLSALFSSFWAEGRGSLDELWEPALVSLSASDDGRADNLKIIVEHDGSFRIELRPSADSKVAVLVVVTDQPAVQVKSLDPSISSSLRYLLEEDERRATFWFATTRQAGGLVHPEGQDPALVLAWLESIEADPTASLSVARLTTKALHL